MYNMNIFGMLSANISVFKNQVEIVGYEKRVLICIAYEGGIHLEALI